MVEVTVGDEDHGEGQTGLANDTVDVVGLVTGIDEGAGLGFGVFQQVAVGADLTHGHTSDL